MKQKHSNEQKPTKNHRFKRFLSTALIVAGLAVIAVPIVGKILTDKKQQNMMDDFYLNLEKDQVTAENVSNDQLDEALNWGTDVINQEELDQNIAAIENDQLDDATVKKMPKAIGIVTIDKIKVNLPIAEGVTLDVLKFAIGHMPGTAELGEIGNTVLAGHRSHTFGSFFNRLDEVEIGDVIVLQKSDGTFVTYEVDHKVFVKPDDLSVLKGNATEKALTLITCHPEINPTSRLIIHAREKL